MGEEEIAEFSRLPDRKRQFWITTVSRIIIPHSPFPIPHLHQKLSDPELTLIFKIIWLVSRLPFNIATDAGFLPVGIDFFVGKQSIDRIS